MKLAKKYGLVGENLTHSFSKQIHDSIGRYDYNLIPLSKKEFADFMEKKDFAGINVTIPYKKSAIKYCDFVEDNAAAIGAVNTICNNNGKLYGYNTDYDGLSYLLEDMKISLRGKIVAILGTGGTSATAFAVAKNAKAKEIFKVTRHKDIVDANNEIITYDELQNRKVNVIVNTTPSGMYPNNQETPLILSELTHKNSLEAIIDVIYNPLNTNLILQGQEMGIKTATGLEMLIAQGVFAANYFGKTDAIHNIDTIKSLTKSFIKSKYNIVLIGMPGSGKTAIGKELAKADSMPFIDTDAMIQKQEKATIKDIFSQKGEEYFRKKEAETIDFVSKMNGQIISTGGGVIKNPSNIKALRQNGIILFIRRPYELLTYGKSRPLSSTKKDLKMLYTQRYDEYINCCHCVINNDKTTQSAVEEIKNAIKQFLTNGRQKI